MPVLHSMINMTVLDFPRPKHDENDSFSSAHCHRTHHTPHQMLMMSSWTTTKMGEKKSVKLMRKFDEWNVRARARPAPANNSPLKTIHFRIWFGRRARAAWRQNHDIWARVNWKKTRAKPKQSERGKRRQEEVCGIFACELLSRCYYVFGSGWYLRS